MSLSENFRNIAMSFPDAVEMPHFEKASFRVKKKIFATLDEKNERACLKLSISEQDLFSLYDKSSIYPVPNKWGKQGWTFVELTKVKEEMLLDAVTAAYNEVAIKKN
jgi:predicted DNA-binding protein (MmcQ/YjbR family)